ncbi:AraC family transcriptional regulator [Actinomycetospora sp. NBRC 106375]|uniref:AraC family transcriptional regulator n=1 Tax=Actinomycetospora sp. NBRC 106375 TaxID=3032207 RepID=UPI0024A33288|nr:AraC family transcriptional regulator [Actinomycetospora sp. NBRC 106375]GLZ45856.1 AraC family transcriptional regulator [Actinomycetospora sp. NBRC 106375]
MAAAGVVRGGFRTADSEDAHERTERLMTGHRMAVGREGAFRADVRWVAGDGLGLLRFSYGAGVEIRSHPLDDFATVHLPSRGGFRAEHRGMRVRASTACGAVFSSSGPLTMQWDPGLDLLVLKIDRVDLERELASLLGRTPDRPLSFDLEAPRGGGTLNGAAELVRSTCVAAGPEGPPERVWSALKHVVGTALLLGHPHSYRDALREPAPPASSTVVRRVLDRAAADPARPPTAPELARLTGVSERTLRTIFHAEFGVGPVTYLRRRRLDAVHRDLSSGEDASVADVALRHGFAHAGRFAAEYRARFGEAPSTTRCAPRR